MTINNPISPENILSTNDPGDDTQLRFRYQAGYSALISLGLLDEDSDYDEVFCEHHEDTLIKMLNGKFTGVQVKTRDDGREPFKSDDGQIFNTIKRFIEQFINFPNHYERFVIATNHGFWANEKENTKNLNFLLTVARQKKSSPSSKMHRELRIYLKSMVNLVNAGCEVSEPVTMDQALDVLCLIELQEELPKFEDLELRIAKSIEQHFDVGDASFVDLTRAAKALIEKALEAASLVYISPKQAYFALCSNPSQERANAIILGKQITRDVVIETLSVNLSARILLRTANKIPISELPTGMDLLEIKMATGDVSADNILMFKDLKFSTEYLLAQWLGKYGALKVNSQFAHISSVVRNECLEAYDATYEDGKPFGPRMLRDIRNRLRERITNDPGQFLGCQYEHLLGVAGILTEMCEVWWSEKFPISEEGKR